MTFDKLGQRLGLAMLIGISLAFGSHAHPQDVADPVAEETGESETAPDTHGSGDSIEAATENGAGSDTLEQQQQAASPQPEDGPAYPVSEFIVRYVRENPGHPPIADIMQLRVPLGRTSQGYVAPRPGVPLVIVSLADAAGTGDTGDSGGAGESQIFYASAIQRILEAIRDYLVQQNLLGVFVAPDPLEISETGEDLRALTPSANPLTIVITTGVVTEIRTLASGERVSERGPILPEERVNHPLHRRILERSPIKPYEQGDAEQLDLLRRDTLDRYLFHLSRHPGRRVDASVAAALEPGGVALDYQVTENRPLVMYAQISNTGTKSTDYWRQRFGFFHSQLTNNDDILSFDYITSWFDETNAVLTSYEAPFSNDRIRWRIHGNWSEFTADQVGFFGDEFVGESWAAGGEIIVNIYQQRELFVDLVGGVRFTNIEVDNRAFLIQGDEDFIIPSISLRLDRTTEWFSTLGSIGLEWWLSNASQNDLAVLGRTAPDTDPMVLQGSLSHSVFLEPLLNLEGWDDPSTPETSTLAHELFMSLRGQYAFGNRLIPQATQVVGGLYSVRGYPESVAAGDSALIGTLEYRYHVPRAFALEPEPRELFGKPFRFAPQHVYGRPDWDLILKTFIDVGRTWQSDRLAFETDETLVGVGVGAELLYRRNLNVRLDWGFALDEVEAANVHRGSNRLHFVATILF